MPTPLSAFSSLYRQQRNKNYSCTLYPQPQTIEANPESGYTLNPITGDTIQPLILENGDTLITGVPIPAKGKTIHPDSVAQPKVVLYTPSDSTYNAHPNVHKTPDNLTVIPVNKDSLTTILVGEITENDTSHYLVNSTGDTLQTGIPIPAKGKTVPTNQPQPTNALPPRFKDAAINNMQYLDVDQGMASSYVSSILEDKSGNLWFGTNGGGVSMYNGESFTHFTEKEGLSNNIVFSILEDKSGNLWFGTYDGGVSMYNGETTNPCREGTCDHDMGVREDLKKHKKATSQSFTHFTQKGGLSNNTVWSILEDKSGNLWLSTENGLNKVVVVDGVGLQPENLPVRQAGVEKTKKVTYDIARFEKNDGLKGMDFYSNSVCLDSKNRMWWGSGKSLTMLDMNKYTSTENPPTIYLRQLDVNEAFIDYRNITDSLGIEIEFNGVQQFENYPLNLELPYNKNHLTFHFSAIDWSALHKIQYSYIMEGLNSNWSQPSHDAKADYRNIPYGTYTFKVGAIGGSGEWSEPFDYEFTIHPPWWHTWWARTGYGISALLLIFGFVRWRTAKLKQRQKELEMEVEEATREIKKEKEEVEKQKEQVEEAHKEITDSIQYAKRIQSAILPPLKIVKEYLPESFILYKPKDVVAGDFYWMESVVSTPLNQQSETMVLFAAADCTGHGVPGAMVSVVCNNGLNRSVREHGLTDPGQILDKTREIVISEFEKSEEDVKDGMDIALCSLEGNTLKYAGAHNPLWIIRNGEVLETKANKQPIGQFDKPQPYITHTFELQKGDRIYIFSDGYVDQFGGEKGKKFKTKAFRELLLSIQEKPMEEQSLIIDKAFENWKGNLEQIDDVCIIGVSV
ncbi:MAG: serine phosphatase RsbU (regulator of sigma subunit) [Parvicellaceae bacterium]|jgi:serine phosphatase RsbU (regulator of sigma subunit)